MVSFHGVKVALFVEEELIVIQRDNKPGLQYAGLWDLPGGGREDDETPEECAIREINEELGITLSSDSFIWQRSFESTHQIAAYFLVAKIERNAMESIHFGDEGTSWKLLIIKDFMDSKDVINILKDRLQLYLDSAFLHHSTESTCCGMGD